MAKKTKLSSHPFKDDEELSKFQSNQGLKITGKYDNATRSRYNSMKTKYKTHSEIMNQKVNSDKSRTINVDGNKNVDKIRQSVANLKAKETLNSLRKEMRNKQTRTSSDNTKNTNNKKEIATQAKVKQGDQRRKLKEENETKATYNKAKQNYEDAKVKLEEINGINPFEQVFSPDWSGNFGYDFNASDDLNYINQIRSFAESAGVPLLLSDEEILANREAYYNRNKIDESIPIYNNYTNGPADIWKWYHSRLYPYGYSDEYGTNYAGVINKLMRGLKETDPRRIAWDEFNTLNLDTPEGMNRANELLPMLDSFSNGNPRYTQRATRARFDLMNLHDNEELLYNTWMVNPDYQSALAQNSGYKFGVGPYAYWTGVPTLIPRDPSIRREYQEQMANFLATNPEPSKTTDKYFIYNVTGDPLVSFGANYSIVQDRDPKNPDRREGLKSRYVDQWDYAFPITDKVPGSNDVIIGDTIPTDYMTRRGRPTMVRLSKEDEKDIEKKN